MPPRLVHDKRAVGGKEGDISHSHDPPPELPDESNFGDNPYWDESSMWETIDPIITTDFAAWCQATLEIVQRSWRSMCLVLFLGVVLPSWAFSVLATPDSFSPIYGIGAFANLPFDVNNMTMMWQVAAALATVFLMAASFLAATRIAVAEAAGGFLSLPEAIRYGLSKSLPLWLWMMLSFVIVTAGIALFVLPGLWAIFALTLIVPVAVFEKRNPLARSVQLIHTDVVPSLARVAFTWFIVIALSAAIQVTVMVLASFILEAAGGWMSGIITALVFGVMALVLIVPYTWIIAANLCTYAFLRAQQEPLTTTLLAAEAASTTTSNDDPPEPTSQ